MEKVKLGGGRSYGQYCGLARALDVVGDRWNLLIVRELLAGPLRYGELRTQLPGVASNLLAERLQAMERAGVLERRLEDGVVLYLLTLWGQELKEALEALGRWGTPLLASGRGDDAFRPRWLTLAIPAMLRGRTATPPVEVGLAVEDCLIILRIDQEGPSAMVDDQVIPSTILRADADTVVGLAAGAITVAQASELGQVQGSIDPLRRAFGS